MESDRIILSRVSDYDMLKSLRQSGINVGDRQISEFLQVVRLAGDRDDKIDSWMELPHFSPGTMEYQFLVPKFYYNINVKRVSLSLAAVILDALVTAGLVSTAMSLSGYAKQGIAKLDTGSGEFCCLVHAVSLKHCEKEVTPYGVRDMIWAKPCPFTKLNCRLMQNAVCNAAAMDIESHFESLKEKGALEKSGDSWNVPL